MKKITDKAEKVVAENIVNAKQLKEMLNQKTANMIKKSDQLMNKAEHKAERMVVRAKGKAQKVISKV
jgi:F0F1-type ATP synthase membrane subunit b/b'